MNECTLVESHFNVFSFQRELFRHMNILPCGLSCTVRLDVRQLAIARFVVCVVGTLVSPAKAAESIKMPLRGRQTRVGERTVYGSAHWHHLANATERFVHCCDAALRRITLITG